VGVWIDYFRAPDPSAAAAVLERFVGPRDLDEPPMDFVFGKGIDPAVTMLRLQSLLTGTPYEELPSVELVAMKGEEGPWVVHLPETLRDALADAGAGRLRELAEPWVRTEEFGGLATATEVLPFLNEITALARRARQASEGLYCWICL
jgi:hypothetical protein